MRPLQSFPPISNRRAEVLILGSMPSRASLSEKEYYAHAQNSFWKIMRDLFGPAKTYRSKKRLLLKNKIALWDVAKSCERQGSLDSNIKNVVFNDIEGFLKRRPNVRIIYLNGRKAESLFRRYAKNKQLLPFSYLPSTSPASARLSYSKKLSLWKKALRQKR